VAKGKFIVIDGTDGSGKATQTELLSQKLKKDGFKIKLADFPQYYKSFFGKMVGRFLAGEFGGLNDVDPYLASVLYAGDRWEASKKIYQWLKAGNIIISNRYTASNMAHQGAKFSQSYKRKKFLSWLGEMEFKIFGIPREDLLIFLDVPYAIGQKLVDKKGARKYVGGKKKDIHESDLSYQEKVRRFYKSLCRENKNWHAINCVKRGEILPKEKIAEEVYEIVKKKL